MSKSGKETSLQDRTDAFLDKSDSLPSAIYHLFMTFLVVVVCVNFVVESYPIDPRLLDILLNIDIGITLIFLADYLVRWWARCFSIPYLFTPMALVDLVSILPLFFVTTHWQFVRILRLFRILRLLRILKDKRFLWWELKEFHLRVAGIFFTLFSLTFISAGVIYEIEGQIRGTSIPTFFDALYFVVVSLSTVGYGDIAPISTAGRAVVLLMIMIGGVLLPWQLTSLARHLIGAQGKHFAACGKCGLDFHENDAHFCRNCGTKLMAQAS